MPSKNSDVFNDLRIQIVDHLYYGARNTVKENCCNYFRIFIDDCYSARYVNTITNEFPFMASFFVTLRIITLYVTYKFNSFVI